MPSSLRFAAALASGLAGFMLLEGAVRAASHLRDRSRLLRNDEELGWVHNTEHPTVFRKNSCGEAVVTIAPPTPYLVRRPSDTSGLRVLFLGDSTTHAHEVSSGHAFYDVVEQLGRGKVSVWAAGVGGYGNLQEALLLRKVYDEVHPSVIVWQLDVNDIANNVPDLDRGLLNNNVQERPYLDPSTGRITRQSPSSWIFRTSEAARSLLSLAIGIDRAWGAGFLERVETWAGPGDGMKPALTRQGLAVLDAVLGAAVIQFPDSRFAGFLASNGPEDEEYRDIFTRHGATYWPDFAAHVAAAPLRTNCDPLDTHWNHEGNRVAGEMLASLLAGMTPLASQETEGP